MKILLFGITGRTGSFVAKEALKRGHKIVAVAREPGKVTLKDVEVIAGTPYDMGTVRKAMTGCEAVIIALSTLPRRGGLLGKIKTPLNIMTVSTSNAIRAMREKNVRRIVVMSALGAGDSAKEIPAFVTFVINLTNIKYSYLDHEAQEEVIEKSDLDWTIVRPVGLNDKNNNLSVLFNLKGEGKIKSTISRNAVAHFMLDCIDQSRFIKQKPGISNG